MIVDITDETDEIDELGADDAWEPGDPVPALPATVELTIPAEHAGQRLDKVLAALATVSAPALSRMRIHALIAAGQVMRGDKPATDPSAKARLDETYRIAVPPLEDATPEAQPIDLNIVYEDSDVIVIDKPAGMVVHPAPGNRDGTLVNALLAHCGSSLSGIGGVARPGIVHRLDKDTSGLMIVAKNDLAHSKLSAQFADRSLSRTYRALVWGVPVPHAGEIDAPIGRSSKDRKKMAVSAKGREALTRYRVLEDFGFASVVECQLATGRTHQIRVHMAYVKSPVVGDVAYKGPRRGRPMPTLLNFPRQALHAVELKFIHPRTGKLRKFSSPLPADIEALLNFCRKHQPD